MYTYRCIYIYIYILRSGAPRMVKQLLDLLKQTLLLSIVTHIFDKCISYEYTYIDSVIEVAETPAKGLPKPVCVYLYVYVYISIYIYIYIYTRLLLFIYLFVYIYIYIYTCIHIRVDV